MEITIITRTDNQAEFTVAVTEAELKSIKAEVYDHLRPRVKAAGFRPGKAPDMLIERELGANTIQSEVIDHALQHTYADAVRQENLNVVASPQVSIEKFVPYTELIYKVIVELLPKPKLGDYTKFKLKRPPVKPDAAKIEVMIEDLRRKESVRLTAERPAITGDEVNFDFSGTKEGIKVPGATAKGQTLRLGSGNFIPGFEAELMGLSAGADKTFDIKFPADYHESSLAGAMVTFAVHLNSVTEVVLPELNDELAAKIGPFKTVAELKADLLGQVTSEAEEQAAKDFEKAVLDKLLESSTFTTPDALVRQQLDRMGSELEQNLRYSGLNLEKYLELTQKTRAELEADMRPEAERRVGLALLLTAVAEAEKLKVGATELDTELMRLKAQYPDPATQAELSSDTTREDVYNHLMASQVIAKLIDYATAK
jgi:trigger factor